MASHLREAEMAAYASAPVIDGPLRRTVYHCAYAIVEALHGGPKVKHDHEHQWRIAERSGLPGYLECTVPGCSAEQAYEPTDS